MIDNNKKKGLIIKMIIADKGKKGMGGPGDGVNQYAIDDPTKAEANMDSGMPHKHKMDGKGGPGDQVAMNLNLKGPNPSPNIGTPSSSMMNGDVPPSPSAVPEIGKSALQSTSKALSPARFSGLSPATKPITPSKQGAMKNAVKKAIGVNKPGATPKVAPQLKKFA